MSLLSAKIVSKILTDKPSDAVDILETSIMVKKTAFNPSEISPPSPKDAAAAVAKTELYVAPSPPIDPDTGEPKAVEPSNAYTTENSFSDAGMFKALGVGLGEAEMYNVMLTMKKLGEDPGIKVSTVRFFGKFLGLSSDYFVFETTLQAPEELPEGCEAGGANTYTYFVCSVLGGAFTILPAVMPEAIIVSRSYKKFLTGDLTAEVGAFPPFPGKEIMLLRAMIARIAASTVLCPEGFFNADEGKLTEAEGYVTKSADEMTALSSWCLRYPGITEQGRCEFLPPEAAEGEEPDMTGSDVIEGATVLTPLEGEGKWAPLTSSEVPGVLYKVAGITSLEWPGAVAAAGFGAFSNMYVGYGYKAVTFCPPPAPPVMEESALGEESNELPEKPVEDSTLDE